ncbi:GDSL-like Lipase/Acylhydrolase family protein [Maribacter dokdonensis]|uniref:GDSL-like Lipase/Acylhydrolase family protein n=1 Tax=Maribacter dokdonensis TaxID=320912 RepID=A0ABY0UIV3_9FLAO|nr:SGNH/GDSL hydrolase family protein [Maribacter dokdonensis]SDS73221.1 GDSL-like Lipase/Acylhydrolase family protein [Maribacter dokdonensis]
MKKFLIKTVGYLIILILTIEVFYGKSPSIFSLRSFVSFSKNIVKGSNNDKTVLNPDGEPIENRKNNIGFYSHSDFIGKDNSQNYAIIGDSFVNSTVVGTYNSIAYLLDERLDSTTVYNFGKAGGNIHDYYRIYDKYNLKSLKKVFIVLTGTNDLSYQDNNNSFERSSSTFVNLIQSKLDGPKLYDAPNYALIRKDTKNIVYILHDNLSESAMRTNGISQDLIEIHIDEALRFSDGHYKKEGNERIADKIVSYLNLKI